MKRAPLSRSGAVAPAIRSFDVFDTVLTRAVGAPEAVFDVVGRRLRDEGALPVEPCTFAAVRGQVATRLVDALQREATIREIHDELAVALGLAPSFADLSLQAELDCERMLSRAVPGAQKMVEAARGSGLVIFLSDTPLPQPFVRELLDAAGLWHSDDRLYCSAEGGESKGRGGALYDVVAQDLGVATTQLRHTGDNLLTDVAEARLKGVTADSAPAARLNRYESILEGEATPSNGLASYLAGASRMGRLRATAEGVNTEVAAGAAGVAAPLLVGFAAWLVGQAAEHELRRLYFVSRDAEVMLQVFRPVAAAMGAGVEARYLYGSRAAWEITSLHDATADQVRDRLVGHPGESMEEAGHLLGLTPADLRHSLGNQFYDSVSTGPLSDRALERLAAAAGSQPLLGRVRAVATERRDLMLDYLTQEGLGTDGPVSGLVDVGWMGRTFQSLDTAMEQADMPAVHSYFYIGRSVGAMRWTSPRLASRQRSWLFDQVTPSGRPDQPSGIEAAIEAMCSGSEGSLGGYAREADNVVPVLVQPTNGPVLEWGLADLRRTIEMVTEELVSAEAPLCRAGDLRGAADGVLRTFWQRPTSAEVEVWGGFPTDDGLEHSAVRPLAVEVRLEEVVASLRAGHLKLRPSFSWRAGTAAVSRAPWQQVLRTMAWYDRHKTELRRMPRRVRLRVARRGAS